MCMGGGGGGGRATIVRPNTSSYDAMLATQRAGIEQTMNNGMLQSQAQMQAAIQQQQMTYRRIADEKRALAEDQRAVNEQALRMSQLIGAPPPEESAQAPVVGDKDRYGTGAQGKKALRIGRKAKKSGKGAGLNISVGG